MPKDDPTKGGGQRGGPKRWTGGGPTPARHIPWPEIFKHHESVLTGHLKMVDMVRKHTAEGTGNHRTILAVVERAQNMINDFREVKRNFVPPRDQLHKVPLGTSSASVYPGYSPADHIYGEAANEYGRQVAEAKRLGLPIPKDPNGPQYVVGQSQVSKAQALQNASQQSSGASTAEAAKLPSMRPSTVAPSMTKSKEMTEVTNEDAPPLFFIDSNPTPVDFNKDKKKKEKRRKSEGEDGEPRKKKVKTDGPAEDAEDAQPKSKKAKIAEPENGGDEMEGIVAAPVVETEDISADVEARLKAKEEKRRKKEKNAEKKRKRQLEDSSLIVDEDATTAAAAAASAAAESTKPKKKKAKTSGDEAERETVEKKSKDKKRHVEVEAAAVEPEAAAKDDGEGKKKQKRKKE